MNIPHKKANKKAIPPLSNFRMGGHPQLKTPKPSKVSRLAKGK